MPLYTYGPGTVFYSLVRFSTKKQADGNSYTRQREAAEAFALQEGIPLDTSLHETDIRKLGMSAFSGAHIVKGPLRKFLAGIEDGTVKAGHAVLLVGEWNRLTRQVSSDATEFTIGLMKKGIGIIDLQDRAYYTLDRYNNDTGLQLGLHLKISMAHQYSKNLSHNLVAAWKNRREKAREGAAKPTNACPEWLYVDENGERKVHEDRLTVIIRILELSANGLGKRAVAKRLNDKANPVPAFRGSKGWHASAVERIIGNVALLGTYIARNAADEPIGEPIPNHYPRVLKDKLGDETLFWRAVAGRNARKPTEHTSSAGRTGAGYANLFKGLIKCAHCGGGLVSPNKGKTGRYLTCSNGQRNRCDNRVHHLYALLEAEALDLFSRHTALFDYDRLLDRGSPQTSEIAATEAAIAERQATLDAMAAGFGSNAPAAFFKRAQTLQAEVDALTAQLAEQKRLAQITEARRGIDNHAEFKAMVDTLPGLPDDEKEAVRTKIAAELRRLIERAEVDGPRMTIWLKPTTYYRIEICIHRSGVESLVVRNLNGEGEIAAGYYPLPDDAALPARAGWGGSRIPRSLLFDPDFSIGGAVAQFTPERLAA